MGRPDRRGVRLAAGSAPVQAVPGRRGADARLARLDGEPRPEHRFAGPASRVRRRMIPLLAVVTPLELLTMVGLAFTAAVCFATMAVVAVAYVVLGSWSATDPVVDE